MLTFLVLLPLHVATLHRCLVVWVAVYMKGWGWGGACERSLYFFRYMLLRCTDVW